MILVFFQNCISPHQIPYISEICNDKRVEAVYLFTPRVDYKCRKDMGWDSSRLLCNTFIRFSLLPTDDYLESIFQKKDVYAFFSGLRADKDIFRWFKLSLKYDVRRGMITEAPNVCLTKPLWLHSVRFLLQDYRYVRYIHYVYAFGDLAVCYYSFWSKKWKVFPFSYCPEVAKCENVCQKKSADGLDLLFVGSINKNKNVYMVLKVLSTLNDDSIHFDIIGDGPERDRLEKYVSEKRISNVVFYGNMDMSKVHVLMHKFDVLVLPSLYDGWGAVVNEALQCGLYVICSDKCGAKALIVNDKLGQVFCSKKDLHQILANINVSELRQNRDYRTNWSYNISGKVLAKYFVDGLLSNDYVHEPWRKFHR